MAKRVDWTRDQQLIALRFYMRLPFGRLHARNPEIIDAAAQIGRSPDALAMKACNFASLDPAFRRTNRVGLSGASHADSLLWQEFERDPESLAAAAEAAYAGVDAERSVRDQSDVTIPVGETDVLRLVRARRVQSFFRSAVITSYDSRCAITGIGIPELLVASHIIPWATSVERRADPRNGLCLNSLFDRAFDRGLITIDAEFRVVISRRLREESRSAELKCSLEEIEGRQLFLPNRFPPAPEALEHHRQYIFQA